MGDDLRDLGFTVLQMVNNQSSRVCSPCSNLVISLQAGFFFIKASFQESVHNDDSFRNRMSAGLMVLRQGNAKSEMLASLIVST